MISTDQQSNIYHIKKHFLHSRSKFFAGILQIDILENVGIIYSHLVRVYCCQLVIDYKYFSPLCIIIISPDPLLLRSVSSSSHQVQASESDCFCFHYHQDSGSDIDSDQDGGGGEDGLGYFSRSEKCST